MIYECFYLQDVYEPDFAWSEIRGKVNTCENADCEIRVAHSYEPHK